MRPPSKPELNTKNNKEWFISWNHDVPFQLWNKYPRRRIRIKVYDNINRYTGEEREKYAAGRLKIWQYAVAHNLYNPFEKALQKLSSIKVETDFIAKQINNVEQEISDNNRSNFELKIALENFIKSRQQRRLAEKTITSYRDTVSWLLEGLAANNYQDIKVGALKHRHMSAAIDYIAEQRKWNATTINSQVCFLMCILNWLVNEDYIAKNPSKSKFVVLPANKSQHKWFDRVLAKKVKERVIKERKIGLLRAMQFTYWMCIRSKSELLKLKVGDIDFDLQRIRFSAELSKNKKEQHRPFTSEFEAILKEIDIKKYPKEYYVFSSNGGNPGPKMCAQNYLATQFKSIKDNLKLSKEYTIYGWKHTRMVHELMKGTDLADISYLARHSDFKTTEIYLRDFDINLKKVYEAKDLTF